MVKAHFHRSRDPLLKEPRNTQTAPIASGLKEEFKQLLLQFLGSSLPAPLAVGIHAHRQWEGALLLQETSWNVLQKSQPAH